MRVLVTGGAGYIGAHLVAALLARGDEVVVVDDLSTGDARRVSGIPLLEMDLASDAAPDLLAAAVRRYGIDAVVHLAARKQVGESVERPAWYHRQNVGGLASVLEAMQETGVARLVVSSTAAVYGAVDGPVDETAATEPVNPYGETKLVGERLVSAVTRSFPLAAISLRYFNVAGAAAARLADRAALNLVPMVFERLDAHERPRLFGDDYPTDDGSAVRDYVHVLDIADAHLAALDALEPGGPGHRVFNVGTGVGTSVLDVLAGIGRVSGLDTTPEVLPRRAGDPATVVARVDRIREELGWSARFGIDDILRSAWDAHLATRG